MIRNPHHVPDIEALGAKPELQDITELSVEQFTDVLSGHDAIIWSAGPVAVHLNVPTLSTAMQLSTPSPQPKGWREPLRHGFLLWRWPDHGVPEDHSFFAYAESKAAADAALRESGLTGRSWDQAP